MAMEHPAYNDTSCRFVISHTLPFTPYIPPLKPWFFCAGGDGTHDTAKGDSGGPLLFKGIQYGITSNGA